MFTTYMIKRILNKNQIVHETVKNFSDLLTKKRKLEDTIKGFKGIIEGQYDHIPEMAFYMTGTIEEVLKKAEKSERTE